MKLHPLDLSYMGVATIWANDLGSWLCFGVVSALR